MNNEFTDGRFHPFGRSEAEDLAILAVGVETGWWDESGRPAPWPQDFLDPAADWTDGGADHGLDWRTQLKSDPAPF